MEITDISISLRNEDKLKAFVNVTFDSCFVVRGMKVIEGNNGLFVSMPSRRANDGTYRDVAHPINSDFREHIEKQILEKYRQVVEASKNDQEGSQDQS